MRLLGTVTLLLVSIPLALACGKGGGSGKDAKSADDDDEITAYDEDGKGFTCEAPESKCEEVEEASLDFKEHCRTAGYKVRQCGCKDACTGNINGERTAFTHKNVEKKCPKPDDKCEMQETSAAFQDACSEAGAQLIECGCEWLCSGKLNEVIPDPPKEEEAKPEDEAKPNDKSKGKDDKSKQKMSMDGPIESKPGKK